MLALIAAVPLSLGIAMRLSKIWRGGWRDILITFGLGWLSVITASVMSYILHLLINSMWPDTLLTNSTVISVLVTCALAVPLIAIVLRKRGPATKAGTIFAIFLMGIWGTLELLDRTTGDNSSVGQVQHVDDDGTIWMRMDDGSIVGHKPIGYDEEGRVKFVIVNKPERSEE